MAKVRAKLKTHKGIKWRVKLTGRGKVMAFRTGRRHLLAGKSSARMRKMRRRRQLSNAQREEVRQLLPYS